MNIAFLGNFQKQKGIDLFIEVVSQLQSSHDWFICGSVQNANSFNTIAKYIKSYGSYNYGDLENRLKKLDVDLVLILNLFPETFSLTFFESIELEYPFIATPVGFPFSIFPDYPYFMKELKPSALIQKIDEINSPGELIRAKSHIKRFKGQHWEEFMIKYKNKYKVIERYLDV
jgi:glycosyltransferase involved in cell wall biosynthesis